MYKILIADDEALEREVLIYLLNQYESFEFEVIECRNGNEAFDNLLSEEPDIAILDIQMPGMTGLEVLEQARKKGYKGRVAFLTAFDKFDFAVKAIKLAAKDYIVKPIEEESFYQIVTEMAEEIEAERLQELMDRKKMLLLKSMEGNFVKKIVIGDIDEEVMDFFQIQGLSYESYGNCICIKMQENTESDLKHLKQQLKDIGKRLGLFQLMYLQNDMLVMVCFYGESEGKILSECPKEKEFLQCLEMALQGNNIEYHCGRGNGFDDLSGIEECYNTAREMLGDLQQGSRKVEHNEKEECRIPKELELVNQYLEENYKEKVTLEKLAQIAGFTKYYLSRLYKKHYKENIMDCLIRIRMEKAKEMLRSGEKNVKLISENVGYTDPNYFAWSFKKYVGDTPIAYWQKHHSIEV